MADEARVALLARPGPAREQLRKSLLDLGATLVAEGDPAELDPAAVGKLGPNIVLVSLEPAIEPALERFDELLGTDGVEVMYDDAEVTKNLEGWDLNRWARHLASKLLGRDLLPPRPDDAPAAELDLQPVPGAPPTPAQLMDNEKLEDYVAESPDLAEWVPTNPSLTGDTPPPEPEAEATPRSRDADELPDFDLDLSSIESAMAGMPDADAPAGRVVAPSTDDLSFDGDFSLELGNLEELLGTEASPPPAAARPAKDEPLLADLDFDGGTVNFSSFSDDDPEAPVGMDDDVAALAAQLEEFEKSDTRETARDPDFAWAPNDDAAKAKEMRATPARTSKPIADVPAPEPKSLEFGSLSLLDDDSLPVEPVKPKPVAAPSFDSLNLSLEPLEETAVAAKAAGAAAAAAQAAQAAAIKGIATPSAPAATSKPAFDTGSLSLETVDFESPGFTEPTVQAAPGAVLVVAGMGGPDAVRQFLSHLPHTLPVPVLLYQHLEVGKHERLVDQLAKVSQLPVYLALPGESAQPGRVAVLPAGMGAARDGDKMRFTGSSLDALLREMPARDSVLVVLSGADTVLIHAAAAFRGDGGTAFAQSPDSCFDAAAAQAVAAQGAATLAPAQIAEKVAQRWPA
jgi:chemotaxis response regulator CheB